jgi:hypothetical protein
MPTLFFLFFILFCSCSSGSKNQDINVGDSYASGLSLSDSINASSEVLSMFNNLSSGNYVYNLCGNKITDIPLQFLKKGELKLDMKLLLKYMDFEEDTDSYGILMPGYIRLDSKIILLFLIPKDACSEANAIILDMNGDFLTHKQISLNDNYGAGLGICFNEKLFVIEDMGFELHGFFKEIPCDDNGMIEENSTVIFKRYTRKFYFDNSLGLKDGEYFENDSTHIMPSNSWGKDFDRYIYCPDIL